jgi:hypothetical protein
MKTATREELPLVMAPPLIPIVQRDDGFFQLGLGEDAPGPFETYSFASAVAAQRREWLDARLKKHALEGDV